FEGFLRRLVEASATGATVVELTKGVTPIAFKPAFAETDEGHAGEPQATGAADGHDNDHGHDQAHHHGSVDPHAFQSIPNAEIYVKNIAGGFCAADAAGCNTDRGNADAYTQKLKALDGEVRAAIAAIPAEKRVVITSHDAFGYF